MSWSALTVVELQALALAFARVAAIILSTPLLSSRTLPVPVKAALALSLSLAVAPLLRGRPPLPGDLLAFALAVAGEVAVGLLLGFAARLLFGAVQLGSQLVSFQLGFGIANVLDPQGGTEVSVLTEFHQLVALLLFLAVNAHHWFVQAVVRSFETIPPGGVHLGADLQGTVMGMTASMFDLAIRLGAPVIAVLILTNVAFGLLARAVPQLNIFILSFPLQIGVGLAAVGLSLTFFAAVLEGAFGDLARGMDRLLRILGTA
ncbi:MAG: flagellar biosynthetic protein FliR [Deltaproteobacteria bacterium]|nr:flagellar biosynthetic protein FliR [Deltaproteobacteria bacterium]